jgi:hypothetical protein
MLGDLIQQLGIELVGIAIRSAVKRMTWCQIISSLAAVAAGIGVIFLLFAISRLEPTPASHWWLIGGMIFGGSGTSLAFLYFAEQSKNRRNRNRRRRLLKRHR